MITTKGRKQMEEAIRKGIETHHVAGMNLMVMKDGEEILYMEDGKKDIETGESIARDTIFRLYSMTKPITAVAAMLLVERGQLDLYEAVGNYLPRFNNAKVFEEDEDGMPRIVPLDRPVAIKDLMNMTSGLLYGGENPTGQITTQLFEHLDSMLFTKDALTTVDFANQLGGLPLAFQPGSSWAYGTSADVLGAVVEVVSGVRFSEFLKKELFEPLGMVDTGFMVEEDKRHRLARTYETTAEGLCLYEGNHLGIIHKMDRQPAFESGGAGLASTIDDYSKFATMLMQRGTFAGQQILQAKTVDFLTSQVLEPQQQEALKSWYELMGHSYGNLMRVATDIQQSGLILSQGEYGWDGWLGCYFANCPKDGITILMMMQKKDAGTTTLTRKLRNIIMSELSE